MPTAEVAALHTLDTAAAYTDAGHSDPAAIAAGKRAARIAAKAVRAGIDPRDAADRVADAFFAAFATELPRRPVIAGYARLGDELDLFPLLRRLNDRGIPLALPVVVQRGQPLLFRRWRVGDGLRPGALRVAEPGPAAPERRPDIVLVPLLAFDRQGRRLGYGAGFYDRTLEKLRRDGPVLAVGVGYAAQQVDRVPCDAQDQPLDALLTERGAVAIEKG